MKALARRGNGIVLAVLVFAQVLLVGQQMQGFPGNSRMSYWTTAVLLPIHRVSQAVVRGVAGSWDRYLWLVGKARENQALDAELGRLRVENYYLQQKLVQIEGQTVLDAYRAELRSTTLAAQVIGRAPSRSTREIFLDRGSRDGIEPGMPVIVPSGIVGRVAAAHSTSSMVVLLSDREFGAGVLIGGSGVPGIVRGMNAPTCAVQYVGSHVPVSRGDRVFTSGLDGVFPRGLPVATVVRAEREGETQRIEVRPLADLDRLRHVAVVLKTEHEALSPQAEWALAQMPADRPGESGRAEPIPGPADRVKQAYRSSLESQSRAIGLLGRRAPDFHAAQDALRAARLRQGTAGGGGTE